MMKLRSSAERRDPQCPGFLQTLIHVKMVISQVKSSFCPIFLCSYHLLVFFTRFSMGKRLFSG